jgi:ParB-like chromosome segregation protein Spo0J
MSPQTNTTTAPETIGSYTVHPVASLFPILEGKDYEELKKSIEQHGQEKPIILQNGVVIDGRTRLTIVLELGQFPYCKEYDSKLPVEEYILIENLFRRHLTDDQRMMITTQVMLRKETEAAQARRQEAGKAHGKSRPKVGAKSTQAIRQPKVSEKIAAAAKGTDYQARQAIAVMDNAPDLVEPVKKGKVRLRDAHKEVHRRRTSKPAPKPESKPKPAPPAFDEAAMDKQIENQTTEVLKCFKACPKDERPEFARRYYAALDVVLGRDEYEETPPADRRSRADRWQAAVDELRELQQEYQEWYDKLPENLQMSAVADKLMAITTIDLSELENVDFPLGFGRD